MSETSQHSIANVALDSQGTGANCPPAIPKIRAFRHTNMQLAALMMKSWVMFASVLEVGWEKIVRRGNLLAAQTRADTESVILRMMVVQWCVLVMRGTKVPIAAKR